MKTIFATLLAISTTLGSFANSTNPESCRVNCPEKNSGTKFTAGAAVPAFDEVASVISSGRHESLFAKRVQLDDSYDELKSYLNFQQTMAGALNQLETEKHLDAIEDLQSQSSYSKLMSNIFLNLEAEKHADAWENLQALENFNTLMEAAFSKSASL